PVSRTVANARLLVGQVALLRGKQVLAALLVQVSQVENGRSRIAANMAWDGQTLAMHGGLPVWRDHNDLIGQLQPVWPILGNQPDIDPQRHELAIIGFCHTDGSDPHDVLELDSRRAVFEACHALQSLAHRLTGYFQGGHSGQDTLPSDSVIVKEKLP